MFGMGIGELSLIFLIVLVVFGAHKLPEIGDGLGKGILNFRKSLKQTDESPAPPTQSLTADHHKPRHG